MNEDLEAVAAKLGLVVSAAQHTALSTYIDLLLKWNATYNLTAVRDRSGMVTQHLADCMSLIPPLSRCGAERRVLDVGSGGGLPGVVVAALLPGWHVTCVDAVAKKVAFVRQVAGVLSLANLRAAHSRVESFEAPPFDLVTCRAFSSLADLVSLTRHLLKPGGAWIAMKGRVPHEEFAALPAGVEVFHVEPLVVPGLDAQRCLVWMREKP